jgi:hypothetical protein
LRWTEESSKIAEMRRLLVMSTITLHAHFDGDQIRLDEPYELEPDTKLLITVLPKEEVDEERENWFRLAASNFANAYAEDETEYSLDSIKEANPEYEGR